MKPVSHRTALALVALVLVACGGTGSAAEEPAPPALTRAGADAEPCEPIAMGEASAPEQEPAFPGQTRACAVESDVDFEVVELASGLVQPWAVEPLPDGHLLVTERPGRLRIVSASGELGPPIRGVPAVDARRQGGLLDVALSPSFATDRTIFLSYAEPREGGNGTTVARAVLSPDRRSLEQVRVVFRALPTYEGAMHYGSRLAFGPDGMLYVTTGERSDRSMRMQAQALDSHMGKVLRIHPDGRVPADNPFAGRPDAAPEVWSLGHRNIQSAAIDPEGRLWTVEHGPRGGDELNRIEPGENYGWPLVTYGEEYSGEPIPNAVTQREGYRQPVYYWDPVIAPSGMEWYTGDAFPDWRGDLFVGGLGVEALVRLEMEDGRVVGEEHLLGERQRRIRDVRAGPDGALYLVTGEDEGELWKIVPRS